MDSAFMSQPNSKDPRFTMYNKEMIKSHLEKRRVRRAHSNIRPRQRFSTISAFHKNDVKTIQQEDGITSRNSKYPIFQPKIGQTRKLLS